MHMIVKYLFNVYTNLKWIEIPFTQNINLAYLPYKIMYFVILKYFQE